jgi:hypothetical protein
MRRIQLTVILIALLTVSAIASVNSEKTGNFQPGYIIAGGDTIKGFILMGDHISNIKQCTFKETSTGHERTYSPDDLEGYGVEGKSFFYVAAIQTEYSTSRKVFLECVVKSKVSFFLYRDRFFLKSGDGVEELVEVNEEIQKNGKSFTTTRPLYKSVLQKQMEDCSTIHENLVNTSLSEKSLAALFKNYASCIGHEAVAFDTRNSKTHKTRYGFTLGLLAADLNLKTESYPRYSFGETASGSASFSFTPSFFMELGISKKFDLCTGITWYYTKNELRSESAVTNLTHNFSLEVSRIEIPVLVKYTLSNGALKWSLKGGVGFDGVVKNDHSLIVSTTGSGYVLSEYTNDLKENGLVMNAMGGICTEFLIGNRSFLIEGFYNKSGSLVKTETHASLEGFKFSLGMFF